MKTKIAMLAALFFFLCSPIYSQTRAVTEKGDTIFVFDDGTWSFTEERAESEVIEEFDFLSKAIKIDTISTPFKVSNTATKTIKSSKMEGFEFKYDDKKWKREPPAQYNEMAEFAFTSKTKDIYCIAIVEEVELGLENLYKIAIHNMEQNTGGTVEIVKSELRTINGTDVIHGVLNMEANGLKFTFDSYYFSNEQGSIQLSTWTGNNVHDKYEGEIEELLNGFMMKSK